LPVRASTGISIRAAAHDDAGAIAALVAANEEAFTGRPSRVGPNDVQSWMQRSDWTNDTWLLEEDGRLVAAGAADSVDTLGVYFGRVAPDQRGRGLGSRIVDLAEARLAEKGVDRVHTWALTGDAAAGALFARRGYHEVRRFWEMAIELDGAPPEPSLPEGLSLETFCERDARPFYEALDESFQDHWEHHPRPFEEWWEQKQRAPGYDPTLWFLVRDGDEIAAVVRNDPDRSGGGLVGALGVRRPWRGRGLGKALLNRTFAEFWRRGVTRVTLGVDAANPTGATRLYESVGMHVELENVVYEKTLG
jgi:mycothiol synthase